MQTRKSELCSVTIAVLTYKSRYGGLNSAAVLQRAGQAQAAAAGGGHRGLAEEDRLPGPGEGRRSGPLLHQRKPR